MFSRREFLILGAGAGALAIVPGTMRGARVDALPLPGSATGLDPGAIPKYVTPLPFPGAMAKSAVLPDGIDYYEIGVRQLQQQILPAGLPTTTVWGYGSLVDQQFRAISNTIEATADVPVRVKWINQLVDAQGRYLPHLLPVDPTLHWANPAGPIDSRVAYTSKPDLYRGPVPMVTHVHGAHTGPESDGYAEAWWLPAANNLAGYVTKGSKYDQYDRANTTPGSAVFQYPNTQRAGAIWYHDHTLGITRLNVYAGPAGFWMIRGGADDLPAGVLPAGPYEVPVVVQDRCFNADGSLWYPDTRAFFDGYTGPELDYVGNGVPPYWVPEFFGNTMMINGVTWPHLDAEARRYRFRFLNGCGARFLRLKVVADDPSTLPADALPFPQAAAVPLSVIGTDGGFLPAVAEVGELLMGPAERFDVVIDFTGMEGHTFYIVNEGPDEPFGGGEGGNDYDIADALSTRQVMRITVGPRVGPDTSVPASQLRLPGPAPLPPADRTRRVSLNELATTFVDAGGNVVFDGPMAAMLGTVDPITNMGMPMPWMDAPTETPLLGATEEWEICNFTMDAHPIHVHLVEFEVTGRAVMDQTTDGTGAVVCQLPVGGATYRAPEGWESGVKDTVIAYPGEITRLKARFDLPGLYQWHCHIAEHEDNEMMRPMAVESNPAVPLGELVQSALAAFGKGSIALSGCIVDGLISAGPSRGLATKGTNSLGGVRLHTGTKPSRSRGTVVVNGITFGDQSALATLAATASAVAASLPGTAAAAITTSRTIQATGRTVVNLPSIQLSGPTKVLTLSGGPTDEFVINVAGGISLANRASIRLVGVLPSQVTFNMTGRRRELAITGGSSAAGTFLDVTGPVRIAGSTVIGSIIAGGEVQISSSTVARV